MTHSAETHALGFRERQSNAVKEKTLTFQRRVSETCAQGSFRVISPPTYGASACLQSVGWLAYTRQRLPTQPGSDFAEVDGLSRGVGDLDHVVPPNTDPLHAGHLGDGEWPLLPVDDADPQVRRISLPAS